MSNCYLLYNVHSDLIFLIFFVIFRYRLEIEFTKSCILYVCRYTQKIGFKPLRECRPLSMRKNEFLFLFLVKHLKYIIAVLMHINL